MKTEKAYGFAVWSILLGSSFLQLDPKPNELSTQEVFFSLTVQNRNLFFGWKTGGAM